MKNYTLFFLIFIGLSCAKDDDVSLPYAPTKEELFDIQNSFACVNQTCVVSENGNFQTLADCESFCGDNNNTSTSEFTDPRDGQKYKIVEIGNQTWFAENLNYEMPTSACYDYDNSNCDIYGRLYSFESALSACPQGWHLPSNLEWNQLITFLGGANIAGGKMKSTIGWNLPNTNATNSSEFSALPAGSFRFSEFRDITESGQWYSSSEDNVIGVITYLLQYNSATIYQASSPPIDLYSVRCIKD